MLQKKRWAELVAPGVWHHLAIILFLPGRPAVMHTHDFPEIFWLERGEGVHFINGRRKRLVAGDVVLVRPEDRHMLEAADPSGFTLVNLAYHAGVRADLIRRHRAEFAPLLQPKSALPFRLQLPLTDLAGLRQSVDALARRQLHG